MADKPIARAVQQEDDGRTFFLTGTLHVDSADYESSLLDLTVISGTDSWAAKGLTRPKSNHKTIFLHITTGLQQNVGDEGTEYKLQLTEKAKKLQITCQWKEPGKAIFSRHQPLVLEAQSLETSVRECLETVQHALSESKEKVAAAQQERGEFQKEAEKAQKLVQDYVNKKNGDRDQILSRVAALLNEKKKRIIELERELARFRGVPKPQSPENSEQQDEDESEDGEEEGGQAESDEENASMASTVDSAHDRAEDAGDVMSADTQPLESDNDSDHPTDTAVASPFKRRKH